MPDFASRRLASTSCVLLPMDETMPIPVTTTRLMIFLPASRRRSSTRAKTRSGSRRLERRHVAKQSDLEIERAVDDRSVGRQPPVGDAQHELRAHHPLDVDAVHQFLDGGDNLPGKFDLAEAERAALALGPSPAE